MLASKQHIHTPSCVCAHVHTCVFHNLSRRKRWRCGACMPALSDTIRHLCTSAPLGVSRAGAACHSKTRAAHSSAREFAHRRKNNTKEHTHATLPFSTCNLLTDSPVVVVVTLLRLLHHGRCGGGVQPETTDLNAKRQKSAEADLAHNITQDTSKELKSSELDKVLR